MNEEYSSNERLLTEVAKIGTSLQFISKQMANIDSTTQKQATELSSLRTEVSYIASGMEEQKLNNKEIASNLQHQINELEQKRENQSQVVNKLTSFKTVTEKRSDRLFKVFIPVVSGLILAIISGLAYIYNEFAAILAKIAR